MESNSWLSKFQAAMQKWVEPIAGKMSQSVILTAIKEGMISSLPFLILGSLFSIIVNFPYAPFVNWLAANHLTSYLNLPYQFTMNSLAIIVAYFTTRSYCKSKHVDNVIPAILSVMSIFILAPLKMIKIKGVATPFIPFDNIGVKGLFLALIVSIIVGELYSRIIKANWTIKMPDSVPSTIGESFKSLIPVVLIATLMTLVRFAFSFTTYGDLNSAIYTLLQVPLVKIGTSPWAILLVVLLNSLFFFFGIHSMAINSIVMPILYTLDFQNLAAYHAGNAIPNIITWRFFYMTSKIGGTGCALGLCLFLAFFAKSKQFKTLGRISLPAVIFNTDEPVIFGMPIVLNPIMFIPFVVAPLVSFGVSYLATLIGWVKPIIGLALPEQTPVLINGFLQSGPAFVILQIVMIIVTSIIYLPFARIADNQALAQEQGNQE
ncbi:PTS sugar transporter subunit IIC [Lactiplantibacillus daoliensis]|uniref:Permease IIC component n=1 Tax=Lactiplantibacillus daoliensis TaxID=2559916 RepID=A0ABW1UC28_9LACO|nr:PTS transporter subunit EIIC [Lactiplantibacillus daoliensis]